MAQEEVQPSFAVFQQNEYVLRSLHRNKAMKTHSLLLVASIILTNSMVSAVATQGQSFFRDKEPEAPTIPDAISKKIKKLAVQRYPDDYSMQLFVIEQQEKAYQELEMMKRPSYVGLAVYDKIKANATRRYPEDFEMRLFVIKSQYKAYLELGHLKRPADIPVEVFKKIGQEAERRYPEDYEMLCFVIKQEIQAYRQVQGSRARR